MANEISIANTQIPAHLANRIGKPSALATSIGGGLSSGEGFPRISIKGSRFRLVEDGAEVILNTTTIDVVIVGANPRLSKLWYAKKWDPNDEPAAPDCFSLNGIAPDPESVSPQNDLCATCPHNAWGSRVTDAGQKLKACADQKRLAVVSADDPEGTVYLLQVTPAALKGLNGFQKELVARGIAPEIVRTKIGFDTDASFPKLTFGFGGFLDEDTINAVDKLFGAAKVLEITGEKPLEPAPKPKAEPKPQLVKEVPAEPAPQPEPVAEAPKAKGFKAQVETLPKATPVVKKVVDESPAPVAPTGSGNALADEISALLAGMAPDDTGDQ